MRSGYPHSRVTLTACQCIAYFAVDTHRRLAQQICGSYTSSFDCLADRCRLGIFVALVFVGMVHSELYPTLSRFPQLL